MPKILESDLCKQFIQIAESEGWSCFPESSGFDILCCKQDIQVGIQAKLHFNTKVLSQALPNPLEYNGPDYRAVLVPKKVGHFHKITDGLGLILLFEDSSLSSILRDDLCWYPERKCEIPQYKSSAIAGSKSPISLTSWKIKSLRLLARIEKRGSVKLKDFKELNLSPSIWICSSKKWLVQGEKGTWIKGKAKFDEQHPEAYAKILSQTT